MRRHIDRAYALALRILDNPADADDVVQDVLLKVWTHRGRWEGGRAKFSTWLYRVVTNRCIDLRRQPRADDLENAPEIPDGNARRRDPAAPHTTCCRRSKAPWASCPTTSGWC